MSEWTQTATVKKGGKIELAIPLLHEGQQVEVVVRDKASATNSLGSKFGCAKGQGWIGDDFDEPLEEFVDYM
ncbi:MAG TPA: DUF2281 domain-containing protein [Fimbriimonas sp.]|nr:DUF2281 domain-containing protein [Fimbriimonas sp.]